MTINFDKDQELKDAYFSGLEEGKRQSKEELRKEYERGFSDGWDLGQGVILKQMKNPRSTDR